MPSRVPASMLHGPGEALAPGRWRSPGRARSCTARAPAICSRSSSCAARLGCSRLVRSCSWSAVVLRLQLVDALPARRRSRPPKNRPMRGDAPRRRARRGRTPDRAADADAADAGAVAAAQVHRDQGERRHEQQQAEHERVASCCPSSPLVPRDARRAPGGRGLRQCRGSEMSTCCSASNSSTHLPEPSATRVQRVVGDVDRHAGLVPQPLVEAPAAARRRR